MALHLVPVAAKDGTGATITGGVAFNDQSGTGAGPDNQAVVLIDSTQQEILGTTAGTAVTTDATGSLQQYLRGLVKLLTAATFKGSITPPTTSDPALVVAISPNSVNPNGRNLPSASAPVVAASQTYTPCPAGATTLLGATGATGDYLDGVLIIPGTTAAGAVSITDGSGTAITIFAGGGTTALTTLVPFYVPVGAISKNGAGGWKVTTLTNVTALGVGNFT